MADPIQVLRDTLNESCISAECHAVGAAEHAEPHAMRDAADAAIAQVEALVEAAAGATFAIWEDSPEEIAAAERLRAALAPFKENP